MQLDQEHSLKKGPVEFCDTVLVGCERNRRVMGNAKAFLLSRWKSGAAIYLNGGDGEISDLEREGSGV